jgi:ferredoxin
VSLLSAAERLAAIDRSEVVLAPDRCLHSLERFSECDQCFEVCPVAAIAPGKPPTLDSEKCESCLACLPKCPVGAFDADDDVASLLKAAARLPGGTLELLCGKNSQPELGADAVATGIRIRHCLASLGAGGFVALAAFGFERILVRSEECASCEWAALRAELETQIAHANHFLQAWGKPTLVASVSELETPEERRLWNAESPPVSRRELFGMMAHQGQVMMARAIEGERQPSERRPGRDRMRLLGAAAHLPPPESDAGVDLGELGFATVSLAQTCTACGTCARACPTGALVFEHSLDSSAYTLKFTAGLCINCEICTHVCAVAAIKLNQTPALPQVFPQETVTLREGNLVKCSMCNALIADHPGVDLCPVCEYRSKHPFGSALPPGLKRIQRKAAKEKAS